MNDPKSYPDFSGKCLSISIIDDDTSHDVYNPYFEYQGERLFIVGTVPPHGATDSGWNAGCQTAIAWDRITDYYVFENLEAYSKAVKIGEDFSQQKPNSPDSN